MSLVILRLEPPTRAQAPVSNTSWTFTGYLNTRREYHTATLLANGKVLVVGGHYYACIGDSCDTFLNTAELYDPATGTWSYTGSLLGDRSYHAATLLPSGQVLVVGGINSHLGGLNTAELYDPATGSWRPTNPCPFAGSHSATLLPNGKVLVGGALYKPATETWKNIGPPHWGLPTLLPSGKVLVVGTDPAELYDPATETWSAAGDLNLIRSAYSATLLRTGKVLVTGSNDFDSANQDLAELYDPATGTWSVTGNLNTVRWDFPEPTLMADGRVLIDGGDDGSGRDTTTSARSAEIYDPATEAWTATSNLVTPRRGHTATLLPTGKILAAAGADFAIDQYETYLASAELFDPGLPRSGPVATLSAASFSQMALASEAIAASHGTRLATSTIPATTNPLPTELAGTTIKIKDSAGSERLAPLFFVSPTQVNYEIPPGTVPGASTVTITSGDGSVSTGVALVNAVAPSLFTANQNGQGVAAAVAMRVKADGSRSYEEIAQFDAAQKSFIARPLDVGPEDEQVFLILFGTGIRFRSSLSHVIATIGGAYAEVSYAAAQPGFVGLDQVNVLVPRSLAGRGEVDVLLTVEAQMANAVTFNIK